MYLSKKQALRYLKCVVTHGKFSSCEDMRKSLLEILDSLNSTFTTYDDLAAWIKTYGKEAMDDFIREDNQLTTLRDDTDIFRLCIGDLNFVQHTMLKLKKPLGLGEISDVVSNFEEELGWAKVMADVIAEYRRDKENGEN